MIINCDVALFIEGLDSNVIFGLLEKGTYQEYTKETIPDKYLDMTACIRKLRNGFLITIYY